MTVGGEGSRTRELLFRCRVGLKARGEWIKSVKPYFVRQRVGNACLGIIRKRVKTSCGNWQGKKSTEPLQHPDEKRWVYGFHQVQVEPGLRGTKPIFLHPTPRESHQERSLPTRALIEDLGHPTAVQTGHADVQENHVWRLLSCLSQSVLAIERHTHRMTIQSQ